MDLPNDEIGISDILAWRDCPRRMSYSMKRWTGEGEPPEAGSEATDYGTAMHFMFHITETLNLSDQEALQQTFDEFGQNLWPDDLMRLKRDLLTYREREPLGVRLIGSEVDARFPLLYHNGRTIYFRGQIDRLYERLDRPGHWLHRDYKSSRWAKTQEEVDKDPQLWAYNLLIHEYWPECDSLHQTLDQLEFEELTTRKTEAERQHMKEWLRRQVRAILNDNSADPRDGLLRPKYNQWCGTCSIATDCPIIDQLSNFAQTHIKAVSDGIELSDETRDKVREYVELMEEASSARKVLDNFEKKVKEMLRDLSQPEREEIGYALANRTIRTFSPMALQEIHRALGPEFYEVAAITQTKLSSHLHGDDRLEPLLDLATRRAGAAYLKKKGQRRRARDKK